MSLTPVAVPFLDLTGEFQELADAWFEAIRTAGRTGNFILGAHVADFERALADYIGVAHAVAVANGTDALMLSLRALDIGPGDEVITTPFTFFATAEAVSLVGATPVFADILPGSYNLDPASVRSRITDKTRAIIPVHLYGQPAPIEELSALARQYRLALVEDCAQAFGARENGRRVGSFGVTSCFSFYPTKILGCYGDGGAITTASAEIAERLRRLRNHGAVQPFMHEAIGTNSRLDEVQAALLRIKLTRVERNIADRRAVAQVYKQLLTGSRMTLPEFVEGHVFNLFTVRAADRERLRQHLSENRIASSVCYPRPLHLQAVYRHLNYRLGDLPVAERAAAEVLSLPIYPGMERTHIERVCQTLLQK